MRFIWVVISYEFRRQFARRAYLFTTFGIPLLAIIAFSIYLGVTQLDNQDTNKEADAKTPEQQLAELYKDYDPVGYVDFSGLFPEPTTPPFNEKVHRYETEAEAQRALKDGEIASYYVIPSDYAETGKVEAFAQTFSINLSEQSDLIESFILASLIQDEATASVYIRLQFPSTIIRHTLEENGESLTRNESDELRDFWLVYVFSIILFVSTMTSSSYLMQSVVEERETRMIEIILSSVRPLRLLSGKVIAMGSLGILQIVVWLGTAVFLGTLAVDNLELFNNFEIRPYSLIISLIYFLGAFLMIGAGSAAIGAITGNLRDASQLLTVIVLPSVAPLWLLAVIAEDPNGTVARVLSLIPITAPLTIVMRATITDIPIIELILSFVSVVLGSLFFIWIASRLFRVGVLLSGSSIPVRQAIRYIFERNPLVIETKNNE